MQRKLPMNSVSGGQSVSSVKCDAECEGFVLKSGLNVGKVGGYEVEKDDADESDAEDGE